MALRSQTCLFWRITVITGNGVEDAFWKIRPVSHADGVLRWASAKITPHVRKAAENGGHQATGIDAGVDLQLGQ